jgi:hypothetical protein
LALPDKFLELRLHVFVQSFADDALSDEVQLIGLLEEVLCLFEAYLKLAFGLLLSVQDGFLRVGCQIHMHNFQDHHPELLHYSFDKRDVFLTHLGMFFVKLITKLIPVWSQIRADLNSVI